MEYIKRAEASERIEAEDNKITEAVQAMLADLRARGEAAVRDYAERFDGWRGEFVFEADKKQTLIAQVPESVRADIRFAHDQARRFAVCDHAGR